MAVLAVLRDASAGWEYEITEDEIVVGGERQKC